MPIDWNNVLTTSTPIVIPMVTTILGYLGGYHTHSLMIKRGNIDAKRERLLKNISKVEDSIYLMLEYSWLNSEIDKNEALLDSSAVKIETTKNNLVALLEDLSRTDNEIKIETNQTKLIFLKKENEKIKEQIVQIGSEIDHYEHMIVKMKQETDRIRSLLSEYKIRLGKDDIGSTLNIIDPNHHISGYFKELLDISSNPKRHFFSDTRAIELKGKINGFFDDQIRKVR